MQSLKEITITVVTKESTTKKPDVIIEEAPLQIIIEYGNQLNRQQEPLSVTMRTPGDDVNLAKGFLFNEGIVKHSEDIFSVEHTGNPVKESAVLVKLAENVAFNAAANKRNFVAAAACGFCGKTNADIINEQSYNVLNNEFFVDAKNIYALPQQINTTQNLFSQSGGSHAVALIGKNGQLIHLCEDVGRHNAMDKLVGFMFAQNKLPLSNCLLLFSGRLGYELVQKSLMAGIPVICAIGAPSSLAIELAEKNNLTVIGFLKKDRFNVYCSAQRIIHT